MAVTGRRATDIDKTKKKAEVSPSKPPTATKTKKGKAAGPPPLLPSPIQSILRGRSQSYKDLVHNESWNSRPSNLPSPGTHPSYSTPSFAIAKDVEIDKEGLEDMRRQVVSAIVKKVRKNPSHTSCESSDHQSILVPHFDPGASCASFNAAGFQARPMRPSMGPHPQCLEKGWLIGQRLHRDWEDHKVGQERDGRESI